MKRIEFVRVRALKNVCIGIDRNLQPDETALIQSDEAVFLVIAGQVEKIDESGAPVTE